MSYYGEIRCAIFAVKWGDQPMIWPFPKGNKPIISFSAICDPGLIRGENQDNVYCDGRFRRDISERLTFRRSGITRGSALFAVADGMGGEANGAQAALEVVGNLDKVGKAGGSSAVVSQLLKVNRAICDMIDTDGGKRMGSTFAGVLFQDRLAHIVNIGDSRVYLFRDKRLVQQSIDDTLVQPMVDMGILTPEAARSHPDKHRLSQHLGIFPDEMLIEPHEKTIQTRAGDVFLLCSDGLTDMLTDEELASCLATEGSIEKASDALLSKALDRGGKDNISILLLKSEGKL